MNCISEEEKLAAIDDYYRHVTIAQRERDVYNKCVQKSVEEFSNRDNQNVHPVPPLSSSIENVHYTFDFSQYVKIPHHLQEKGPTFFIQARKVQLFGVRIDGYKQLNYLIDEDKSIGADGQLVHGPDAVISMLDHAFTQFCLAERECWIHADNCFGQNKNRYVMAYLSWRTITRRYEKIHYMMMIPGHTKCIIDAGFGHIKKLYRRSDVDTLDHVRDVVNKAAGCHEAVMYKSQDGWKWREWKHFLGDRYKKVNEVSKYQYFVFSSEQPGIVVCRESACTSGPEAEAVESRQQICKTHLLEMCGEVLPPEIQPRGLSVAIQRYLFNTVRPLIREAYRDITCPEPTTVTTEE